MNRELADLGAILCHASCVFRLRRHDDTVEAGPRRRKCEGGWHDTEERGDHVGLEGNTENGRRHVDEPERKGWNKAQEQEIAQSIFLETLAQFAEPGRGAV